MSVQRPLPAICAVPAGVGIALYSFSSGRFLEFSLFINLLLIFCLLYAWGSRYGTRFELQAPSRLREGSNAEFTFLINTRGWFPRFIVSSTMETEHPSSTKESHPRHHHKLFFTPLTKGLRNIRKQSTALVEEHEYRMDGFIHSGGASRINRNLEFSERGVFRLVSLRLYFTDPLGIFAIRRTFKIDRKLLILVKPAPGGARLKLAGAAGRFDTNIHVGQTGERTEYAGTRQYRPGDELRHIHWPTVARTGELYVREYTPATADAALVLLVRNAHRPLTPHWCHPEAGEFMLRTATAMILELFQRQILVAFGTNNAGGYCVEIAGSSHYLQAFHEYVSSLSWHCSATSDTSWLAKVEMAGANSPAAVIFLVDPPAPETLQVIVKEIQYRYSRITIVANCNPAEMELPPGALAVNCDPGRPELFFETVDI